MLHTSQLTSIQCILPVPLLLFQRLSYQLRKNVASILASVDVLVTRLPALWPGADFCQFGVPNLGLEEILPLCPP
jgi:hypothetical protein